MGTVLNKLRSIAEDSAQDQQLHYDPEAATAGKEISNANFTRTMARLTAIKDAVSADNYNALRAGVRSLYMNHRPNLQQLTALMDLVETLLAYVAEDQSLFQRLKDDLSKDQKEIETDGDQTGAFPSGSGPETIAEPEVGAPSTAKPPKQPEMRSLKA